MSLVDVDAPTSDHGHGCPFSTRGSPAQSAADSSLTTLALARGVVIELYSDAPPALIIPDLNSRFPIAAFDASVLCSLADHRGPGDHASSRISTEVFSLLAASGTIAHRTSMDAPARTASSLTLSDWAVLRASQYDPLAPSDTDALLELSEHVSPDDQRETLLPQPPRPPSVTLWEAVTRRRSIRNGPTRDVPLTTLSALFTYAARTAASGHDQSRPISYRPAASAGARHPIDIYLVSVRVESLSPGIYQYDSLSHSLRGLVTSPPLVTRLAPLLCRALTPDVDSFPALLLLFDVVVDRTGIKYGPASGGLILRDLGCLIQQLHLVITGLDLIGCAIGRLPAELMERVLRLDLKRHVVLGGFAVW